MNKIDETTKLIVKQILAEVVLAEKPTIMYSDAINKFLRMHNIKHVNSATQWRYNLKTGKLHTSDGNPYDEIRIGGANETGYSPTGYWIPKIHTLIAYGYQAYGEFKYPDQRMLDFVLKQLRASDIKYIFIVKGA